MESNIALKLGIGYQFDFWGLQELIFSPQILHAKKYHELPLDFKDLLQLLAYIDSANGKVIVDQFLL